MWERRSLPIAVAICLATVASAIAVGAAAAAHLYDVVTRENQP